jgi:ribosomal-protein-alanine N-acetyltransferase
MMPQSMTLVVNDRIHLSELRPSDKTACLEHLSNKEIYDRTLRIPFPYTEADFETWLVIVDKTTNQHGQPVHWAIRNEADSMIGAIGFEGVDIGKSHRAEVGYWLAKPYWGQGIMTDVLRRACNHAFGAWGLVKISAHVFSFNPASARVLEKCGFEREGYLKKHHLKDGQYIDAWLYGLLRDEMY